MSAETSLIKVNHKALTNQNNHQTSHVTNNYLNQQSWYLKGLSQCANQKTMCLEDNIYVSTIFICAERNTPTQYILLYMYMTFPIYLLIFMLKSIEKITAMNLVCLH